MDGGRARLRAWFVLLSVSVWAAPGGAVPRLFVRASGLVPVTYGRLVRPPFWACVGARRTIHLFFFFFFWGEVSSLVLSVVCRFAVVGVLVSFTLWLGRPFGYF